MNDIEQTQRSSLGIALGLAGMAAAVAAACATGVVAIFAWIVAGLCLAGFALDSLTPQETAFDAYCRECDEQIVQAPDESVISLEPQPVQNHRWRQSVASSRTAQPRRR